jgi:hypothetical protein
MKTTTIKTAYCCCLLLLFAAGCSKDDEPAPNPTEPIVESALSVTPADIPAAYTAGTYTIAVTSNVAWRAAVNSGATWCTVSPATGTGNGSVTVSVKDNAATITRSATVTLAASTTLTRTVGVTQTAVTFTISEVDNAPPYAASNKAWMFGNSQLIWSDAIHCPECNKETFEDSYTDPQCRSYTEDGKTYYYYNWAYVDANKTTMCPDPWRVPARDDFSAIISNTNSPTLLSVWGYGGYATGSAVVYETDRARYWSSYSWSRETAVSLQSYWGSLGTPQNFKDLGLFVRCVK